MEGQSVADLGGPDYNGGRGTLKYLCQDSAKIPLTAPYRNTHGDWMERTNVWVRYQPEEGPLKKGPLTLGYTPYGERHHFGPELGLGRVVGERLPGQVLLIKTAWGGKSLYEDFRPPSSGGAVGRYYLKMLAEIRDALAHLKRDFPDYDGAGYELAGLVWYQGWNDGVDPRRAVPEYEANLANLIRDLRLELKAPRLPVVIGELTGLWVQAPPEWAALRRAQAAVATHAEFAGTVRFVATHDFVRRPEDSPNPGHGHHEFGNAETGLLVGEALGRGMADLLAGEAARGHVTRSVEGWTVRISERLLREERAATEKALELLGAQLREIVRAVPATAVADLRGVTLWFSPEYPGVGPRAEYHPGADWLRENGRDPAMARGVEFTNVRNFATEMERMPNFSLHELAHAYHDRVLADGFDNREIKAAYERAKAAGTYNRVERHFGNGRPNTFERAYALTNPMEYFAEATEAFFSRNDFFPFDHVQLKQHDPEAERLLAKLWGLPQ